MGEILPIVLGCFLGTMIRFPRKVRAVLFPIGCIGAGALASAVNGELSSNLWAVFVSFDSLLVAAGAVASMTTLWVYERHRTAT
jgi:hypothetical protein